MATAVMERTVNRVGLHIRCIERALHQPEAWSVLLDENVMGVHIEINQGAEELSVTFMAGPMPEGLHCVSLNFEGRPMFVDTVDFKNGAWWAHRLTVKLS
jgi:hypothetical protein